MNNISKKHHKRIEIQKLLLYPHDNTKPPIDLRYNTILLEIYESLFKNSLNGMMVINDHSGIMEFAPLIGGEIIEIKFRTDKNFNWIEKKFKIYSIKNETPLDSANVKNKSITIYFDSETSFQNLQKQYSKSFYQMYIHEIINYLMKNMLNDKFYYLEKTKNIINYVMPFSYPFQAINYLSNIAESSEENDIGMLFYETTKGFVFSSLSRLLKQKPKLTFTRIKTFEDKQYIGNITTGHKLNIVFDLYRNFTQEGMGKTVYYFDFKKKYFDKYDSSLKDYYDKTWNLGHYGLFEKSLYEDKELSNIREMKVEKNYLKQNLFNSIRFNMLQDYQLVVNLSGNSDLNVGDIIKIEYESKDKKEKTNKRLKGNWIIVDIKHKYFAGDYINVIKLVKDSFFLLNLPEFKQFMLQINNKKNV